MDGSSALCPHFSWLLQQCSQGQQRGWCFSAWIGTKSPQSGLQGRGVRRCFKSWREKTDNQTKSTADNAALVTLFFINWNGAEEALGCCPWLKENGNHKKMWCLRPCFALLCAVKCAKLQEPVLICPTAVPSGNRKHRAVALLCNLFLSLDAWQLYLGENVLFFWGAFALWEVAREQQERNTGIFSLQLLLHPLFPGPFLSHASCCSTVLCLKRHLWRSWQLLWGCMGIFFCMHRDPCAAPWVSRKPCHWQASCVWMRLLQGGSQYWWGQLKVINSLKSNQGIHITKLHCAVHPAAGHVAEDTDAAPLDSVVGYRDVQAG